MPVKTGKDSKGCWAAWGDQKKYYYECGNAEARGKAQQKAHIQGIAAIKNGASEKMAEIKVGFDYDGTLSTDKGKELAAEKVVQGASVYIISARKSKAGMLKIAMKLGIAPSRIFATGSNKGKIRKIKALELNEFYDNKQEVIDAVNSETKTKGNIV